MLDFGDLSERSPKRCERLYSVQRGRPVRADRTALPDR